MQKFKKGDPVACTRYGMHQTGTVIRDNGQGVVWVRFPGLNGDGIARWLHADSLTLDRELTDAEVAHRAMAFADETLHDTLHDTNAQDRETIFAVMNALDVVEREADKALTAENDHAQD